MDRILASLVATVVIAATFAMGQAGKVEQSLTQMEREWVEAAQKGEQAENYIRKRAEVEQSMMQLRYQDARELIQATLLTG